MRAFLVFLPYAVLVALVFALPAIGSQSQWTELQFWQATASCSMSGVHARAITVTGTTASTGPLQRGRFRVACTNDSHLYQSVAGATGATAGANDALVVGEHPEYFFADANTEYVAFIQASTGGTCYVSECH